MENQEKKNLPELPRKGDNLQQTLDIAYKAIGNPMVVTDIAFNLLAHTENSVRDDPLWNELTTSLTFSHDTVDFFQREKFIEAYAESDVVSVMKSAKLKYDRANAKLFDKDGLQIGDVTVIACYRPLRDGDLLLLESISEAVSAVLQEGEMHNEIKKVFPETFMNDLIEGKQVDNALIESALDDLCVDLKGNLYVAVVDVSQYEHTLTHLVYFQDLFAQLHCGPKYFIYLNYIVMLMSTDRSSFNPAIEMGRLNDFFEKYGLFAGISSSFDNLFEVRKYYKQALSALNRGISENNGQFFFNFDDYLLDYSLDVINDKMELSGLCHPAVSLIKMYDNENGTNYLNIIYCYILNGMQLNPAAVKMKMDPDKLSGHLKKIADIFGINWFNGNMLSSIFMSIKILKINE